MSIIDSTASTDSNRAGRTIVIPFLLLMLLASRWSLLDHLDGRRFEDVQRVSLKETPWNAQSPSGLMESGARNRFRRGRPAAPIARVVPTRHQAQGQRGDEDTVSRCCLWDGQAAVSTGVTG